MSLNNNERIDILKYMIGDHYQYLMIISISSSTL